MTLDVVQELSNFLHPATDILHECVKDLQLNGTTFALL